jgi:uncharacterized protein (DUF1697 family)
VPSYVALLRGINLGARNRLAMADLRGLLEKLGYDDVRTHLQSGNAVFGAGTRSARSVESAVESAIEETLSMQIRVLVRTAAEMANVVAADPLGDRATDHARYMVVFLEKPVPASALADIEPAAYEPEQFDVDGRHLYLWLPEGSHASRLARVLSETRLGGAATMRNWRTVTKLAELAGAKPATR